MGVGSWLKRLNWPLLAVVLVWGGNYTSIKLGLRELPPLVWAPVRFTLAALLAGGLLHRQERDFAIAREDWPRLAVAGVLGFGVANILFTVALRYTTVTNSALLLAISPVITALLSWASGEERFWPAKLAGVLVSFAGVAVLLGGNAGAFAASGSTLLGDLLCFGGAVLAGAYPVAIVPLLRRYSSLKVTAWTFAISAATMWVAAPVELARVDLARLTLLTPGSLLYSAVLAAVFAQIIWNNAISRRGATQVAVYLYLPPLVAAAVSAAVLGERPQLAQLAGALVIFAGLYLVKRPEPAPARPLEMTGDDAPGNRPH